MKIKTNGEIVEPFEDEGRNYEPGAAERVEAFLDARKTMGGIDQEIITGIGGLEEALPLTVADLRDLIADAREFYATRAV